MAGCRRWDGPRCTRPVRWMRGWVRNRCSFRDDAGSTGASPREHARASTVLAGAGLLTPGSPAPTVFPARQPVTRWSERPRLQRRLRAGLAPASLEAHVGAPAIRSDLARPPVQRQASEVPEGVRAAEVPDRCPPDRWRYAPKRKQHPKPGIPPVRTATRGGQAQRREPGVPSPHPPRSQVARPSTPGSVQYPAARQVAAVRRTCWHNVDPSRTTRPMAWVHVEFSTQTHELRASRGAKARTFGAEDSHPRSEGGLEAHQSRPYAIAQPGVSPHPTHPVRQRSRRLNSVPTAQHPASERPSWGSPPTPTRLRTPQLGVPSPTPPVRERPSWGSPPTPPVREPQFEQDGPLFPVETEPARRRVDLPALCSQAERLRSVAPKRSQTANGAASAGSRWWVGGGGRPIRVADRQGASIALV